VCCASLKWVPAICIPCLQICLSLIVDMSIKCVVPAQVRCSKAMLYGVALQEEAQQHPGKVVKINRAPVLTLWVKTVAEREGCACSTGMRAQTDRQSAQCTPARS
jgi:hypothetical protein